ncbi:MAG: DUF2125 domain-containing protein [Pseudomonadota bacterium]
MKRALIIVGGIAVLLAVGWGFLWNAGREQVNARLDAEIASLKSLGTEITFSERAIGGFPFAYEVTARDVVIVEAEGQRTYSLPEITARTELSETERLVINLPETFTLEVTPNEAARAAQPELLEQYLVEFETIAAQVTTTGLPGAGRLVETEAESFLAVYGDASTETSMAVELAGFTSRIEHPPQINDAPVTLAADIGLIDYVARGTADTGAAITFEGSVNGAQISGSSMSRSIGELQAVLTGGLTKGFDLTVRSSSNVSRVHTAGSPNTPAGSFTSSGGASAALISMQDGILDLKGDARATSMELVSDSEGSFKGGKVDIEIVDFAYSVPIAPTPDMQPFLMKLAMVDIEMDDKIWSSLDPNDALDRGPAALVLDAEGTMRATKLSTEVQPGEAPPFEVGNVSLKDLNLSMLGMKAKAEGDVEVLQPLNLPVGSVDVTLNNVDEVLEALSASGVLPAQNMLIAQLMLNNYTLPGAEEGERTAKVVMNPEGFFVNGQPLGGPR